MTEDCHIEIQLKWEKGTTLVGITTEVNKFRPGNLPNLVDVCEPEVLPWIRERWEESSLEHYDLTYANQLQGCGNHLPHL